MRKIILAAFLLTILICITWTITNYSKTSFDNSIIKSINSYQKTVDILLTNKKIILKNLSGDTTTIRDTSTIFTTNRYYFETTILKRNDNIPEIKQLLNLWDNRLLVPEDFIFSLSFGKDNTIVFVVKYFDGIFVTPSISHYLLFDPNDNFERNHNSYPFETIKKKRIDKNWIYLIQKQYFND